MAIVVGVVLSILSMARDELISDLLVISGL